MSLSAELSAAEKVAAVTMNELDHEGVDLLVREHITGTPHTPGACPVSELLFRRTGFEWMVGMSVAAVLGGKGRRKRAIASVYLPDNVRELIHRFDRGEIPQLLA